MKHILVLLVSLPFLVSCEVLYDSPTSINQSITSQYLIDGIANGTLNLYLQNNQIFRYTGKPGIVTIPIGNADFSRYEPCFVLYVATGTTDATIVSSAIIKLDDQEVLNTSDFSKNAGQFTFEICNLTSTSVISVEVRGKPGSYLNIWIEGKSINERGTFIDDRDGKVYKWAKIGNQIWMTENLAYLPSVGRPAYMEGSSAEPRYYVWVYEGDSEGNTSVAAAKQSPYYGIYGVLYNAPAAMGGNLSSETSPSGIKGACPVGWHVPSDAEWNQLGRTINDEYNLQQYPDEEIPQWWNGVGRYLKTSTQWNNVCAYPPGNPPCNPPNYDPYGFIIEGIDTYGFSAYPSGILSMSDQLWGGWDGGTLYRADYWSTSSTNPDVNTVWQLNWLDAAMTHYPASMLKSFGVSVRCIRDN